MSDLARRREARDLWVSRSHLHAAVVFLALMALSTFGLGYALGRSGVAAAEATLASETLVGDVPGTELVELLAEVERGRVVHTSSAIEYPTWAEDEDGLEVPDPDDVLPPAGVDATITPPPQAPLPSVDAAPEGDWTIAIGRFSSAAEARAVKGHMVAQGHEAWLSLRLEGGELGLGVAVGGFEDEAEATRVAEALAPAVETAPTALGTPEVVATATW